MVDLSAQSGGVKLLFAKPVPDAFVNLENGFVGARVHHVGNFASVPHPGSDTAVVNDMTNGYTDVNKYTICLEIQEF
jgi:hypothetical protein